MNVDLHNNARISFVTPSPILVYEFPANGFLADRIYVSGDSQTQYQYMAWVSRLKIARQIAHAISKTERKLILYRNQSLLLKRLKRSFKETSLHLLHF